jgi:fatty-acyl-CoA synthase
VGTIFDAFLRLARGHSANACIAVPSRPGRSYHPAGLRLTYGETLVEVATLQATYHDRGYGLGHRIGLLLDSQPDMILHMLALNGLGASIVPLNPDLRRDELRYVLRHSEVDLVVTLAHRGEQLAAACETLDAAPAIASLVDIRQALPRPRKPIRRGRRQATTEAAILYTSGTTAAPKGVVLSHRSHWLNAAVVGWGLGLSEADRYLHTLPMFHVNGWGLPLAAAALGVPQVVQREVRGPTILERVGSEGITLLCGATPVATTIEEAALGLRDAGTAVPGEGTTRMVSGGAPTPAPAIARFERATGWELIHAYGLTESGPVLTVNRVLPDEGLEPAGRAERLAAAGAPLVGVRLRVDADGQVLARTAKKMSGYWRQPELSAEAFDGEWLRTGDGGELTDGVLRITDRKKDMIVTGGENVSSLQVESCLLEHPDVADGAVIGVPHERWGETPKALVVLRDGATLDEAALIDFCRERLAHFKCPTSIEAIDSLPRTATGKVQKYLLRGRRGPRC